MGAARDQSVQTALRNGTWQTVSDGLLPRAATVVVITDILTTTYGLYSPRYGESNLYLAWLADIDPAVSLTILVGFYVVHLAVTWLSFGWLSLVVATYLIVVVGLGSLNNLVLVGTGSALYARVWIPSSMIIHVIKPTVSIMLGLVIARRRGPLPWIEVLLFVVPGIAIIAFPVLS